MVITDWFMPKMNGLESIQQIRQRQGILASGYDKAHVMAGDHPELPQVFLSKPYKRKGLSEAISGALVKGVKG